MPRKYVNKGLRKPVDAEKLVNALKEVLENGSSIRDAATAFGVSKSSLARHVKDLKLPETTDTTQGNTPIPVVSTTVIQTMMSAMRNQQTNNNSFPISFNIFFDRFHLNFSF